MDQRRLNQKTTVGTNKTLKQKYGTFVLWYNDVMQGVIESDRNKDIL
jgi:hypothetical protein